MGKGKYGISFEAYAAIAFILAIFGMKTFLILFVIFLIAGEKNEWASRQSIQALIYCLGSKLIRETLHFCSDPFWDFSWREGFFQNMMHFYHGTLDWVSAVIGISIIIFLVIGLIRVCQGKEAKLPLADQLAHWFYRNQPSNADNKTI